MSYNLLLDAGVRALALRLVRQASAQGGAGAALGGGRGGAEEAARRHRARAPTAVVRVDSLALEGCGLGESACKLLADLVLLPLRDADSVRVLALQGLKLSNNPRVADAGILHFQGMLMCPEGF